MPTDSFYARRALFVQRPSAIDMIPPSIITDLIEECRCDLFRLGKPTDIGGLAVKRLLAYVYRFHAFLDVYYWRDLAPVRPSSF